MNSGVQHVWAQSAQYFNETVHKYKWIPVLTYDLLLLKTVETKRNGILSPLLYKLKVRNIYSIMATGQPCKPENNEFLIMFFIV